MRRSEDPIHEVFRGSHPLQGSHPFPQDENFVAALLRYFHLPMRRFPGVQYLACCSTSSGVAVPAKAKSACFSRACVNRKLPSREDAAAVCTAAAAAAPAAAAAAVNSSDALGAQRASGLSSSSPGTLTPRRIEGEGRTISPSSADVNGTLVRDMARAAYKASTLLRGKYRSEVEAAIQHSMAYWLPGARYMLEVGVETMFACRPRKVKRRCTWVARRLRTTCSV